MNNIGLDEGDDSEEEDDINGFNSAPKSSKFEPLHPFKDLYPNSDIVKAMREYGSNIAPLTMIGMLMNYAGNHLLNYISS